MSGSLSHKHGAAALVMVAIMATVTLCIGAGSSDQAQLPRDQCVFIDHHVHRDGVLLEGQGIGLMIDFPTYSFDKEQRKLSGLVNFDVNGSLIAVYGDGQSLGGAMGGGAATMLYGVYALPYDSRGLAIRSVDKSGAVTILYKNETIVLQPGQEWSNITSGVITSGNDTRINATTTDRIVNYGLIDKNDVVKR